MICFTCSQSALPRKGSAIQPAPALQLMLALTLIWLWDELQQENDLACTAAQGLGLL